MYVHNKMPHAALGLLYTGPGRSNFSIRTSVILHNMFISNSEQDKLPDIPTLASNDPYIVSLPGIITIQYDPIPSRFSRLLIYLRRTYEPKAGAFIDGLICGHCKGDPGHFQCYKMRKKSRWVSIHNLLRNILIPIDSPQLHLFARTCCETPYFPPRVLRTRLEQSYTPLTSKIP